MPREPLYPGRCTAAPAVTDCIARVGQHGWRACGVPAACHRAQGRRAPSQSAAAPLLGRLGHRVGLSARSCIPVWPMRLGGPGAMLRHASCMLEAAWVLGGGMGHLRGGSLGPGTSVHNDTRTGHGVARTRPGVSRMGHDLDGLRDSYGNTSHEYASNLMLILYYTIRGRIFSARSCMPSRSPHQDGITGRARCSKKAPARMIVRCT